MVQSPSANLGVPGRTVFLLWGAVCVLLAVQFRYPPLSYPSLGAFQSVALGILMLGICTLAVPYRSQHRKQAWVTGFCGVSLVAWAILRWVIAGRPVSGLETCGTLLTALSWGVVGLALSRATHSPAENQVSPNAVFRSAFLAPLAVGAIACGIHALLQYLVFYDVSLKLLLDQVGSRSPTPLEAGLIHHFRLKRVASIWGDPNALACFSAMGFAASVSLLAGKDEPSPSALQNRILRIIGGLGILGSLTAVFLSGSRGGILDVLLVSVLYTCYYGPFRKISRSGGGATLVPLVLAFWLVARGVLAVQEGVPSADGSRKVVAEKIGEAAPSGWVWRSTTLRERLYYAQVGLRMFESAPVWGLGPGSVELYFGRYKAPEARESKYMHNWILQVLAELGLVGTILAVGFAGGITWMSFRSGHAPIFLRVVVPVFLLDALVQLSFNQRELMTLFGLFSGMLLGWREVESAPPSRIHYLKSLPVPAFAALACWLLVAPSLVGSQHVLNARDLLEEGHYSDARQELRKAQALLPRDPFVQLELANMEIRNGNASIARQLLESAVRLQPESASLRCALGGVHEKMGSLPAAENCYREALLRYPSHPEYNLRLGQLLLKQGRRQEGMKHLEAASQYSQGLLYADYYQGKLKEARNASGHP